MEGALGVIGVFFVPALVVILIVWFKTLENRKRNKQQAELCALALEKGQPIPADLFAQPKRKGNPLNTGIICIAVAIGVSLFLWMAVDPEDNLRAASLGVIPFFIGIAYLIIHFIGKKQGADEQAK